MIVLDGKKVALGIQENIKKKVEFFQHKTRRKPHLCVVLVGDDKASHVYVKNKELACEKVGFTSTVRRLPATTSNLELKNLLQDLNNNSDIDAVLVQLPLPSGLDAKIVQSDLHYQKDADALTYMSMGYLFSGSFSWDKSVAPCTPSGIMRLLQEYQIPTKGRHAVVVGRSTIVGKPMAHLLLQADCTVSICHSQTQNLASHTLQGDIVIAAAGQRHLLGKEHFKQGCVVVDVGIHGSGQGQGLAGDVRFHELQDHVYAATPVPGGVGPLTIAMLLENTCKLAYTRAELVYAEL